MRSRGTPLLSHADRRHFFFFSFSSSSFFLARESSFFAAASSHWRAAASSFSTPSPVRQRKPSAYCAQAEPFSAFFFSNSIVFFSVSCFAFSASAGGGGAGTALVVPLAGALAGGTALGGAGAGLEAGAPPGGGGLFDGGTILRVSWRADCAPELGTNMSWMPASRQSRETVFMDG